MVTILRKLAVQLACVGLALCSHPAFADPHAVGKKGIGLAESKGQDASVLRVLKVHWYYNWGDKTKLSASAQFVPMAFSPRRVPGIEGGKTLLLGFNEPDHEKQGHATVEEALRVWPQLASRAQRIGAPAMAGNPLATNSWLKRFMAGGPRVDFVTVHWYKGVDAQRFIVDIEAVCDAFGKPVWVTEFAPQTARRASEAPDRFTQAQVEAFLRETTEWMERSSCVERYAWHDPKAGTAALFVEGVLTATGRAYAAAGR